MLNAKRLLERDALRLKGVNLLDDPIDVEFGSFTTLANWVHGKLYSIKKKRGVGSVLGGAMLPISECTPAGSQVIECGTEIVMACGETILSTVGITLITCGTDPLTALGGSEITCA